MLNKPQLTTAEQWRAKFLNDDKGLVGDYFKQVKLEALRWAAEQFVEGGNPEIFRDKILNKIKEIGE